MAMRSVDEVGDEVEDGNNARDEAMSRVLEKNKKLINSIRMMPAILADPVVKELESKKKALEQDRVLHDELGREELRWKQVNLDAINKRDELDSLEMKKHKLEEQRAVAARLRDLNNQYLSLSRS